MPRISTSTAPPSKEDIRRERKAANLSQTKAAEKVHAKLRTWQQWEAGDHEMHPAFWELFLIKTRRLRKKAGTATEEGSGGVGWPSHIHSGDLGQ